MPGFVIHLAIAKNYIAKHRKQIKDEEKFLKGVIAPDLNEILTEVTKNKSKTHYGKWGKFQIETNIDLFLQDKDVDIKLDFWKGYFLHLLTDFYFYNKYFSKETKQIQNENSNFYTDYDYLNKDLIKKYDIEKIDNLEKYMQIIDGKTKYLKVDKIIDFIEDISEMDLTEKVNLIKEKGMEALK